DRLEVGPPGSGPLAGRIAAVLYLGAQVAYEVEVAGTRLLAETPNPQERGLYPRGEPVGVRLLPRSLHLLPEA
ncbi:MAG: TOBE domain-containing protein, partial [candidate division NC10 bacterium]